MFIIIMNTGDYRELNAKTYKEAEQILHCMLTTEEIKETEAEIIEE